MIRSCQIIVLVFGLIGFGAYGQVDSCFDGGMRPAIFEHVEDGFFSDSNYSYKWYIIEHEDGSLENLFGEEINPEDSLKVLHTAKVLSTHQGEHYMNFCKAQSYGDILRIHIYGGLPAYASDLIITLEGAQYDCDFSAAYPAPNDGMSWRIKRKSLKLNKPVYHRGDDIRGWLSIELEETIWNNGTPTRKNYKLEGFFKGLVH